MNSISLLPSIRILCIPPYYENHFELAITRFITQHKNVQYQLFTIDKKYLPKHDLNLLLSMSRTIIHEEHIQLLIADSCQSQLIVAKLCQEYPQLRNGGMNFFSTLQCINRSLMIDVFGIDQCIPTLSVEITQDYTKDLLDIQTFLSEKKTRGYIKSVYGSDNQLSSFSFTTLETLAKILSTYVELYEEQYKTNLDSLYRIYISQKQYPSICIASYLVQPFYDLVTNPHWRLVIANACIYDKEIIMWPLTDGYSGWPFLAEKSLAIMPIINTLYIRFREHLTHLISNHHLHYGWIECSYFISCTNDIRLISIKPIYSVYLTEAFNAISQDGNPILAMMQLSNRQRPLTPILNGKTVYIHRLWTIIHETSCINDLIHMSEVKRIHRSNICLNRYVRLCFREDDIIDHSNSEMFIEIGFIQVYGEYHEIGLTNLIEFRSLLLKKPQSFPFSHSSMLVTDPYQFDPITCLPSDQLLARLDEHRKEAETTR
ncbi:hypothetical protein I4U23_009084 [Adineta vaga]|nr:hypothetical protein I4U23_009084 [Adineta vaga]